MEKRHHSTWFLVMSSLITGLLGLEACQFGGSSQIATETMDVSAMETAAVQTYVMGLTLSAPTLTNTPEPTSTPKITDTPIPSITPTVTETFLLYRVLDSTEAADLLPTHIAYYLINLVSSEDCTYYMRPVIQYPFPLKTGSVINDVTAALTMLFKLDELSISGFLNPLKPTGHTVLSVVQDGASLTIDIKGNPMRTEDPCVNHQMRDQVVTTAGKAAADYGIYDIVIWVESNLLYDDYMIGK